ncbi:MAG: sigma-70 family RNA polymerase sigma factor [Verrucomicrobiales bacterium]|nr:sigma-70 family RNA polymerase sigma factor [Verrucomicrobiales bacterium]MCP5526234.1 sigma-70 family RNA polymerase sigma factor [Verrucomicrobiales bacterium]
MKDDKPAAAFSTTQWTVVLSARAADGEASWQALRQLCQTYWAPLYAFLRRQGCSPADAEDFVQGFFEKLLASGALASVARDKGRFRSFLLKALQHHVANTQRNRRAQRRGGTAEHLSLNDDAALDRCEESLKTAAPPETVFDRVWARTVISNAARDLRLDYEESGRGPLFEVLGRWLATEARAGEYAVYAPGLGLSEAALAAVVFRMRRRFREIVRAHVAQTVLSPADIDDEMNYLLRILIETAET